MIFSQVVLALRTGVQSRLHGYALSTLQFATFLLPVSLVHRLPTFYYGALRSRCFTNFQGLVTDICTVHILNKRVQWGVCKTCLSTLHDMVNFLLMQ